MVTTWSTLRSRLPTNTLVLGVLTAGVLAASVPESLISAYKEGGFYLFSMSFVTDIPKRLHGPGWFRFILQPSVALVLGFRAGAASRAIQAPKDRTGEPWEQRRNYSLINLLLMGVLMDSSLQWAILGSSYPGAALVVGPFLVMAPYTFARTIRMRFFNEDTKNYNAT